MHLQLLLNPHHFHWLLIICYWLFAFQITQIVTQTHFRLHFVTFNVADNKRMPGYKFSDEIIKRLWELPIKLTNKADEPIYVLALQEDCDRCSKNKINRLAQQILQVIKTHEIKVVGNGLAKNLEVISVSLTRESRVCELIFCQRRRPFAALSQHGTSVLMVFARKQFILGPIVKYKQKCTKNAEKGVIGVHFTVGVKGDSQQLQQHICLAGLHLDPSNSIRPREECLRQFFANSGFPKECSLMYIAGDFNTRTANKTREVIDEPFLTPPPKQILGEMSKSDEMDSETPYSGSMSLLDFMNEYTSCDGDRLRDSLPLYLNLNRMMPSYSVLKPSACKNKLCYQPARPISWTDRIICFQCGKVLFYGTLESLYSKSDHLPVAGLFRVELVPQPETCQRKN